MNQSCAFPFAPALLALLLMTSGVLDAQDSHTINGFQTPRLDANIAPTIADHAPIPEVVGQPKNLTGHPSLLWDQDDIDQYKALLKTNKEFQIQFEAMKAEVDKRIAQPIEVPAPKRGPDGNYLFLGDLFPDIEPGALWGGSPKITEGWKKFNINCTLDGDFISNCATIYVLTGEEKYGDYAKKLLLAWSHCYEYGPAGPNMQMRFGMGFLDQQFVEGLKLIHFAFAYDLIYKMKSWTPEERKQVDGEFFYPFVNSWFYWWDPNNPNPPSKDLNFDSTNRGMLRTASIYALGVVTGNKQIIDAALYGIKKDQSPDLAERNHFPPRQDWYVGTPDNPGHGGLLDDYYSEKMIAGRQMWVEPSPAYAQYALGGMIVASEVGWRHGVDLYRHNNGILKRMSDYQIELGYPDLTVPALGISPRISLLSGVTPTMFAFAYRRYRDPRYLTFINPPTQKQYLGAIADPATDMKRLKIKSARGLAMYSSHFGALPPSPTFMYELDPNASGTIAASPSVNFSIRGIGIIRTPSVNGKYSQGVIQNSGLNEEKDTSDKLGIDVFAFDDVLMPGSGCVCQDANQLTKWTSTTLSKNNLTVDQETQFPRGAHSGYDIPRGIKVHADQTVFAYASTVGMQRAWSDTVYKSITLDRGVFLTSKYLADIYGAFSSTPRKFDLAWHIRGEPTTELEFNPITFDQSVKGYNWFTSARAADATDKTLTVTSTRGDNVARLHLAGGMPTQAILAEGGIYRDMTSDSPKGSPLCPTIIERRENAASTIYGNALDFSNDKDGYVKGVSQEGSLNVGYALLKVTTKAGADLCFVSYRPGSYSAEGLQTDALQAFAQMNGTEPQVLYLGGGKSLKVGDASITRSDIGLAYMEKTADGNYIIVNPSSTPATVSVTLPALASLKAYTLDTNNQKGAQAHVTKADKTVTLQLAPGAKVEFAKASDHGSQ